MSGQTASCFRVGFGRVNITPRESVPLGGYGNTSKRLSLSVLSELYATCVAFSDSDGSTILLFHMDLISSAALNPAREAVAAATGIPYDRVMVCATHNHTSPDLNNEEIASIPKYKEALKGWMTEAAQAALADRKPAEMYIGSTWFEGANFVRHYVMDDGTYAGDNFGEVVGKRYAGHTTEADHTMQILKFTREGGEDVVMVNWQAHPHRAGGGKKTEISSDVVGSMRDMMEETLGYKFAYFTGGAGNCNSKSRIAEENPVGDYLECGQYMAKHAIAAMPTLTKAETGRIHTIHELYTARCNHTQDHLVDVAAKIRKDWEDSWDTAAAKEAGKPYGIHSPYHAGAIIRKSKLPETMNVPMYAFSIGDVAFITAAYEMFDTSGSQIKCGSPYKMTFICSCANGGVGYIPSAYGYAHGCYEADCTPLAPGTAEELVMEYIKLLAAIYHEA